MKVSVLMSLYLKEKPEYLDKCLNSVFLQSRPADEVIVIEDGPITPELDGVLNSYEKAHHELRRIKLSKNQGLGKALNVGLRYCSNDLVIRMDTDDICFPERFEKQIKFMSDHPEIDICSSWIEEFEENIGNVISIKKVPLTHEDISKFIGKRNPLNHPAVIFRKSTVLKVGGYQHFPLFEDWFLWVRMYVAGARFANIPEPLLYFRTSPQMFRRRGGINYAINSAKFQWTLHKLGLISSFSAIKASLMRGIVYMMPNSLRAYIYSKFLRS